jgi:hypothetical protein
VNRKINLIPYAEYISDVDPALLAIDLNELANSSRSGGLYEIGMAPQAPRAMYGGKGFLHIWRAEKRLRKESAQPNESHKVIEVTDFNGEVKTWSRVIGAIAIYESPEVVRREPDGQLPRTRRMPDVALPRAYYYIQLFSDRKFDPDGLLTIEALRQAKTELDQDRTLGKYAMTLLREGQHDLMGSAFESIGMHATDVGRYAVTAATQLWESNEPCILYANITPDLGMLALSTPLEP